MRPKVEEGDEEPIAMSDTNLYKPGLTKEQRAEIARQNGRKGGRKKGTRTIEAEMARAYIAKNVGRYMPMIFQALVEKAKTGDVPAVKELFDRAFGKAFQQMDFTSKGESINPSGTDVKELSQKFDDFFKKINE
jgi:hypothetical protein